MKFEYDARAFTFDKDTILAAEVEDPASLPVGALHGPRDNASVLDPLRLLDAYRIVEGLTRRLVVTEAPVEAAPSP